MEIEWERKGKGKRGEREKGKERGENHGGCERTGKRNKLGYLVARTLTFPPTPPLFFLFLM